MLYYCAITVKKKINNNNTILTQNKIHFNLILYFIEKLCHFVNQI